MILLLLVALLFVQTNSITFTTTKQFYNGSITFDGLFKVCHTVGANVVGRPCTTVQLYNGAWKQKIPYSWILDMEFNCLGYTTNNSYTDGTCFSTSLGYITTCTCEMLLPICCYY